MTNLMPLDKVCAYCSHYRIGRWNPEYKTAAWCARWGQYFPNVRPGHWPGTRSCKHWERSEFDGKIFEEGKP